MTTEQNTKTLWTTRVSGAEAVFVGENMIANGDGFKIRRSFIRGIAQGVNDGWMTSKDGVNWSGNYANRKEANEALRSA